MNGLIRYKENSVNLNGVLYVLGFENESLGYNGTIDYIFCIDFFGIGGIIEDYEENIRWVFYDIAEGEKVYNYILDTYFTDIEKEMNK